MREPMEVARRDIHERRLDDLDEGSIPDLADVERICMFFIFMGLSQPIDCATKQTKKWLTDGAHRGGTEDKRIDLPRLEGREGQGLLSCLQWKGRERTED